MGKVRVFMEKRICDVQWFRKKWNFQV